MNQKPKRKADQKPKRGNLFAPNGARIIGTADLIPGTALILQDSIKLLSDGSFDFEWDGETKVHWDGQETRRTHNGDGHRLFIDENGDEWPENKLKLGAA